MERNLARHEEHGGSSVGVIASTLGFACAAVLTVLTFLDVEHISQNELGFVYHLNSGEPVSSEANPLLSYGYKAVWGVNARYFTVSSEVVSISFTEEVVPSSPYDESLTWDSSEGVTMKGDVTVFGQVTNVWKFYESFGQTQRSYAAADGIPEESLYEALRLAADFLAVRMGELTATVEAEEIRQSPGLYGDQLTEAVAAYMEPYGFTVTRVTFPQRFVFPNGDAIAEARDKVREVNAEIEEAGETKNQAVGAAAEALSTSEREAAQLLSEAERYDAALRSSTDAEIDRLRQLIESAGGPDQALALELARVQGDLAKAGHLGQVILTDESVVGRSFYLGVTPPIQD